MPYVHYCRRCRKAQGTLSDLGRFDLRVGSIQGLHEICYECLLLHPRESMLAVLRDAHQQGKIDLASRQRAEANIDHILATAARQEQAATERQRQRELEMDDLRARQAQRQFNREEYS